MDRGASSRLLTWMLLPVSVVLVLSATSLSRQPYTGLVVRGDWVAAVVPGSPADRAGFAPGDRLTLPRDAGPTLQESPLSSAAPGRPIVLLRERAHSLSEVRLVPGRLPDGERRMMAVFLLVASGFVILGGWVWSERRDHLTRALFLLCLAFAVVLSPRPRFSSASAGLVYEAFYSAASVFLPALFIHFFALFPDAGRLRGRLASATRIAYAVAGGLFAAGLVATIAPAFLPDFPGGVMSLVQAMAGLWFAAGLLGALVLFLRSYSRAATPDARRRLRVVLFGTALGVAPLAALVALRNLSPGTSVPGERLAVVATLLVPASFAWATAVHRIFEVRVALRAAIVVLVLTGGAALVYLLGEWLAATWRSDLGAGIAGGALAFVGLIAAVAGPAGSWVRGAAARLVPGVGEPALYECLARNPAVRRGSADEILEVASASLAACLRLDGCLAVAVEAGEPRLAARIGRTGVPAVSADLAAALEGVSGAVALDDAPLATGDRVALGRAGVSWLLAAGDGPLRAVLLLGRRLSGPWLGLREARDLERFAEQLEVLLENATLRRQTSAHGALDRELVRAAAVQARLLPRRIPAYRQLDCAAAALSCELVGGDYYDFVRGRGKTLTLAVGDAAGKGVPAALMGVWAQGSFRSHARQGSRPGQVLCALNRELVSMDQPDAFVALLCARVDVRNGRLSFANAGLTPPIVRRRDGSAEELTESGVLLGVTPAASYQDTAVDLDAGDVLVLYTDGLTEARHGEEMFGTARIREVLDRHFRRPAAEIVRELLASVQAFADQPLDDMTVVVLKQRTRPA